MVELAQLYNEQKRNFANDSDNLIAVDDRTNQEKSDKGPVRLKPPMESFWCEYAKKWQWVKSKYGLALSVREQQALSVMKDTCDQS